MTLGFLFGSKNFCKLLCVSWEFFFFTRIWLNPLCCQVLYHYSVSMIVSRFTSFTQNFEILSYEITKTFRSWHDCTSAFSARGTCNFGSQRIRLDPLGGQVLHHDSVSMIVSRFTSFTKNFVICCYQVTKTFCSRYGCASAFSARTTCNFGSPADIAISVLREVNITTVLTRYHFCSRLWRQFMRRTGSVSMFSNTFIYQTVPELL